MEYKETTKLQIHELDLNSDKKEITNFLYQVSQKTSDVGMTYEWRKSLIEANLKESPPISVSFSDGSKKTIAIFSLFKSFSKLGPFKGNTLNTLACNYSTFGGLAILENEKTVLTEFFNYLDKEHLWHQCNFSVEKGSPLEQVIHQISQKASLKIDTHAIEGSPYTLLPNSMEDFLSTKSNNFRMNIKRKSKKLEQLGEINFEIVTSADKLKTILEEIFIIEKNSWKAIENSAITSHQNQIDFYSILAHRMASCNRLRIYILRLNNIPIAYDFGLLYKDIYWMLKTSFDLKYKNHSPGIVLRKLVYEDLFGINCKEHNFLWGSELYKKQWATGTHEFVGIRVFNTRKVFGKLLFTKQKISNLLKPSS